MLIKLIVCQVSQKNKAIFSQAQARWSKLKNVRGFIGQCGGWNTSKREEAVILGFWADEAAYSIFMQDDHDPILEQTKQAGTYEGITITLLQSLPHADSSGFVNELPKADCLKIEEQPSLEDRPNQGLVLCKLGSSLPVARLSILPVEESTRTKGNAQEVGTAGQRYEQAEADAGTRRISLEPDWNVFA